MCDNKPGVPRNIAVKKLQYGWRRALREVRIVEVPSARSAEVRFNLAKLEG
jgi:hypothetical protein